MHIQVTNYKGIRVVDANPDGVCLIVGPNGVGKTTLLQSLELLRNSFLHGFAKALSYSGGSYGFLNFNLPSDTQTIFSIEIGGFIWELKPIINSGAISESLKKENSTLFTVEPGVSQFQYKSDKFAIRANETALKHIYDYQTFENDSEFEAFVQPLAHYQDYYNYHLWRLRKEGSFDGTENELKSSGENAFSVLRNWQTSRPKRERYEFVIEVLREAFPHFFEELDFERAGQTISIRLFQPNSDKPISVFSASNGFLVALLNLMAVCSVPDGGIVAIDEPENGLHPYAIRTIIEAIRDRAAEHNLTVLLATHSPVVLNQFKEEPEKVYVMEQNEPEQLIRLDKHRSPDWLIHFSLGDLYGNAFARPMPLSLSSRR
jgi:predicted ATPase